MFPSYFMSRYTSDMFYTFEFVAVIFFIILLSILAKRSGEKNSLMVFLLFGLLHSTLELIAQGIGVREITDTYLFGSIHISYPFLPFILGFFEGGVFCLFAYHFVRSMMNRDHFSIKFVTIFAIVYLALNTFGALGGIWGGSVYTSRVVFNPIGMIFLAISVPVSFGYFFLNKKVTTAHRKSFVYFYLGLVLVTALLIIPFHIMGLRFIEVDVGGTIVYASLPEQILVMYGYNLAIEATGFFLPLYVLIYHFKVIELGQ